MADTLRLRRLEPGQGKTITLSTVLSTLVAAASLFTFGKPLLVGWISDAAASETGKQIKAEVAKAKQEIMETQQQQLSPMVAGMRILLEGEIDRLEKDIARLEYRQQRGTDWQASDAVELVDKRATLARRRSALAAFDQAKRDSP